MKKCLQLLSITTAFIFLITGTAMALQLGTNITIYDKSSTTDYSGTGIGLEDNEVEPKCIKAQQWDLEGVFIKGNTLTLVGGFDFKNGFSNVRSGDLFIDITGDAKYGTSSNGGGDMNNGKVPNTFGYDYVLDLDFATLSYIIYRIDESSMVRRVDHKENEGSNPWRYESGGEKIGNGTISYKANLTGTDVGMQSWYKEDTHYAASFDLGFLGADQNFISHFTLECGNDDLMGQGKTAPVPEPATLLLLGSGLIGLGFRHKKSSINS